MVRRDCLAQLWEGPGCGRVGSHVQVDNSAGRVFHDHEHVKHSESGACDDAEIAGDDGRGVILEKS